MPPKEPKFGKPDVVVSPDQMLDIAQQQTADDEAELENHVDAMADVATPEQSPGTAVELATSTAVAVVEPTGALQAFAENEWGDADSGLENWQHVGFSLPRIISDMRPGGGWEDEVTTQKAEALSVIFLAAMPARAYWAEEFGKGDKAPDCRSVDMVRPDPSSPNQQSVTCGSCPHAMWTDEPPACKERINTLVFMPDSGELRRLTISGTSVKHFRRYVSALQARAARKPIYAQVTDVSLEQVEGDGMRWLEAHFTEGEPISPQMAAGTLMPLQREVSAAWKSMVAEDLASAEADGTAVARGDAIDVPFSDEEPF